MEVAPARIAIETGVSLHVARGRPGGRPMVLLPAYGDTWWSWSRVLDELPSEIDGIAADPRGHGDSDKPGCCFTVPDHSADVVALLDALAVERAILVGHSGSALVARHVALTHPDRVLGLVLIDSPLALEREWLREFLESVQALTDPVPEPFIRDFQSGAAYAPLPGDFFQRLVNESAKMPARVWRDEIEGLLAYRDADDLGHLSMPTMLIWGDRDTTVPRDDQDALARAIPGAELRVLAETGHSPHWERPGLVVDLLVGFSSRFV